MSRSDDFKRISAMAGLDENGGILPPEPGAKIDQSPNPWWKTKQYDEPAGYVCPLMPREIEAVKLYADGYSAKQVAHVMGIGVGALGYLTTNACRACKAHNRTHLVSIVLRKGWIQ